MITDQHNPLTAQNRVFSYEDYSIGGTELEFRPVFPPAKQCRAVNKLLTDLAKNKSMKPLFSGTVRV
jgi:hypothetical protein